MEEVIALLPYTEPFLFVDELSALTEERVEGSYTFKASEYFYQGHFKDKPVTPGVILTECMAQIGLVCMGIHLLKQQSKTPFDSAAFQVAFTAADVQFLLPVLPDTKVRVESSRLYWRLGKLKCAVNMYNQEGGEVARGTMSGMLRATPVKK
jgi:3-hydroxyacyl-[acyl-carrier-protein] dehydratase